MRTGLALRIVLLGATTLSLVILTMLLAFQWQRAQDTGKDAAFPFPDQIAAIVELLERTPKAQLPTVLRALNSAELRVQLQNVAPDNSEPGLTLRDVEWSVARYLNALDERPTKVRLLRGDSGSERILRLAIQLQSGQWAVIAVRGRLLRQIAGRPLRILVVASLVLIALAAMLALKRQIRPLEDLVRTVDSIGTPKELALPPPSGAPELQRLIQAFAAMQGRNRLMLEHRNLLFAALSHDFGTYLTRLRLRLDGLPAPQCAATERDLDDMQDLLRDMLELARPGGTSPMPAIASTNLGALLREVCGRAAETGLLVQLTPPPDLWVRGSYRSLSRVVNNLIDNACKYGHQAKLSLHLTGDWAELHVDDRGTGIPYDQRELAVQPFWRGDTARNLNQSGSGLGLAIVNELLRRLDGQLEFADRPRGGLRVIVRLPTSAASPALRSGAVPNDTPIAMPVRPLGSGRRRAGP